MQEVAVHLYDDLDHAQRPKAERREATGTHTISLDGWTAELDLCRENYEILLELLTPWLEAGRGRKPAGRRPGRQPYGRGTKNIFGANHPLKHLREPLREWLAEQGIPIGNNRGYVSMDLQELFFRANPELLNGHGNHQDEGDSAT